MAYRFAIDHDHTPKRAGVTRVTGRNQNRNNNETGTLPADRCNYIA